MNPVPVKLIVEGEAPMLVATLRQARPETRFMGASARSSTPPAHGRHLTRYLNETRRFPLLEAEEELMFARRWREQQDRDAADRLITSHLRLVVRIAIDFRGYGLPIPDLIAEGNVGLIRAVHGFDPDRGVRLTTYAVWWIRASIQEYVLRNWSLVRIGTSAAQRRLFFKLRRVKAQIKVVEEGDLLPEQASLISLRLKVPLGQVVSMNRRLAAPDSSLDAPVTAGSEDRWQDRLADDNPNQEIQLAEREEVSNRRRLLGQALAALGDRERAILIERRLKEVPRTLQMVGEEQGISPERVRQIEVSAYRKIEAAIRQASDISGAPAGRSPRQTTQGTRNQVSL